MATARRATRSIILPDTPHCGIGICDPQRTQGLKAPAPRGSYALVNLNGPGLFLSAIVTKQGGPTGLTFVSLDIDGRNVVNLSFAAARNAGLAAPNSFGVQFLSGVGLESVAIGWPFPLTYKRSLRLSVVVNENGVVQILANVVRGSSG